MNVSTPRSFALLSLVCLWICGGLIGTLPANAGDAASAPASAPTTAPAPAHFAGIPPAVGAPPAAPAPAAPAQAPSGAQGAQGASDERSSADDQEQDDEQEDGADKQTERHRPRHHGRRHGDSVVMIGRDATLAAGEHADSVVSIAGSANSAGEADTVVSILGDTRVTGEVQDSAVAVMGSTYVDSKISGEAVAVLGNVELGPNAEVGGDVVAVGGAVHRAPTAIVHGTVQSVGGYGAGSAWLRPWVEHCLFYGRPLAFVAGIDWAWAIAVSMLVLYLCFALVFREGVSRCAQTLETSPGMTVLAALLTVLLWPLLLALLAITVIGLAAVPLMAASLLCAALFGKAVALTWIGRRCLGGFGKDSTSHPALALLLGGFIVLVLYVIPVLGFIVFQVLGLFGLGAVVYTLVLEVRSRRGVRDSGSSAAMPAGTPPASAASTAPADTQPATAPAASATPDAATAALPHAGFWIRMAALLVDVLVVAIPTSLLHHDGPHLHLVVLAIYGAAMWKLKGATIGCMVFDLKVVRQDGRPIEWETAIVRALGCFLSLAVAGLGFFWIVVDRAKLAWHDKIAGTAVVRVARTSKA